VILKLMSDVRHNSNDEDDNIHHYVREPSEAFQFGELTIEERVNVAYSSPPRSPLDACKGKQDNPK
jgi:hypothetical protein